MAQVDSPPRTNLALQPSPVLMEAVLKVDQVVARLQKFQTTISRVHSSPVNSKHTWISGANRFGEKNAGPVGCHDNHRWISLNDHKADSRVQSKIQPEATEQFAKFCAEEMRQDGLRKAQEPADESPELEKRFGKDIKGRDIAFPTKAQVQKTMRAKSSSLRPLSGFKVGGFPSDVTVKLFPPAKLHRGRDPPSKDNNKRNCGRASSHGRRVKSCSRSNSSSPKPLVSRPLRLNAESPETKRGRLFSSPCKSFRESANDADDELLGPRRSMTVTEIRGSMKLWMLTHTEGMLFSNTLNSLSPPRISADRLTPAKIVSTIGRRKSCLTHPFPNSPELAERELTKLRITTSANPLLQTISKTTFKRESPTKVASKSLVLTRAIKRENKARKAAMTRAVRHVEMASVGGPQKSSTVTMLDLLQIKSPSHLPATPVVLSDQPSRKLMPLDVNTSVSNRPVVMDRSNKLAEDFLCRASHSHANASAKVEIPGHKPSRPFACSMYGSSVDNSVKENIQVPCVPVAASFLRNMSSTPTPNRSLSRKSPGFSLIHRAKVWVSSQAVKQGKVLHLER